MFELLTTLGKPSVEFLPPRPQKPAEVRIAENKDNQFISPEIEYALNQFYNLLFKGQIKVKSEQEMKNAIIKVLIESKFDERKIDAILIDDIMNKIRKKGVGNNGILRINMTPLYMYFEVGAFSKGNYNIRFATMTSKGNTLPNPNTQDT
jgi:hypothetical protein